MPKVVRLFTFTLPPDTEPNSAFPPKLVNPEPLKAVIEPLLTNETVPALLTELSDRYPFRVRLPADVTVWLKVESTVAPV